MLRLSAPSHRGAKDKPRKAITLSVAAGLSVLAHTAAIGLLLTLKPVVSLKPVVYSAPTVEVIEISLVPEHALGNARANDPSAIAGDSTLGGPARFADTSERASANSPDWSDSLNISRSFDMPTLPKFTRRTHPHAFDALATVLDCLAAPGRTRRTQPPCKSDDPPLRGPVATLLPTNEPQPNVSDNYYRIFKPTQSVFIESVIPDEIPPANRALEKWIAGLFH